MKSGINYLYISKLQQGNLLSLGIDNLFHPTFHGARDY